MKPLFNYQGADMRKRVVSGLLAALLVLIATAVLADQYTDQGWSLKSEKNGLKIYNREKAGSSIKELLAITDVDAPSWRVFAVIGDYDSFKDFMPYTKVSKVLEKKPVSDKKTINYFLTALELPLVANRYYTLQLTDEKDVDGKPGVYRSAWTMSKEPGLDPSWDDPKVKDLFPKGFSNPIKTAINNGYWLIEPTGDGSRSHINYYVFTDPGGKIPAWVANQANGTAVPKLMSALRDRLKDPRYDRFAPK